MHLNRCTLVGELADAPNVRQAGNARVMSVRVGTTEAWKDRQSGDLRERVDWHIVEVWSPEVIEACERVLRKGSLVLVEGPLKTRKWTDKQGNDRWQTVVSVRPYTGSFIALDAPGAPKTGKRKSDVSEMWEDVMGTDTPF